MIRSYLSDLAFFDVCQETIGFFNPYTDVCLNTSKIKGFLLIVF